MKGGTFITRCRFGFPRQECDRATLLTVDQCMKLSHTTVDQCMKLSHTKMYNLVHACSEIISITLVTTSMWYYLKSKHVLMTMFLLSHIVYIHSCSAAPHAIHRSSLNTEWRQLMVVESVLNELEHLVPLSQMMLSTSCNGSEEHIQHCVVPSV